MTRDDRIRPLREILHQMTARYLTVRPDGIEIQKDRPLVPLLDAQILAYGGARTLYRGRRPVCRSLDGIKAISDSQKPCADCLERKHCTPQVRLDLLADGLPYRLLLAYTSAKNFLLFVGKSPNTQPIDAVQTRLHVLNRGSWGELRFENLSRRPS